MKKCIIIALCICLVVSAAACSQRGDIKEPVTSQSQPVQENPSTPSEREFGSELPSSSDVGELLEQSGIDEADIEQPDPTLPENQAGSSYRWDHVEYKKFGDISTYYDVALELHDYSAENTGRQAEIINAAMRLPSCCLLDEYGGVINYDGNFANGNIKIGGPPSAYERLNNEETIKNNGSLSYSFEAHVTNPLSGETYTMVETRENQVGGYYQTQKFMRYIGEAMGPIETHLLLYVVDLGDGYLTDLYFFVSPKATAKDLEVYDAIANSVEIIN